MAEEPPTWNEILERIQLGDIKGARSLFNLGVAMRFGKGSSVNNGDTIRDAKLERDFQALIEDTRGLSQGVTLSDECLASMAISLKCIADELIEIRRRIS